MCPLLDLVAPTLAIEILESLADVCLVLSFLTGGLEPSPVQPRVEADADSRLTKQVALSNTSAVRCWNPRNCIWIQCLYARYLL